MRPSLKIVLPRAIVLRITPRNVLPTYGLNLCRSSKSAIFNVVEPRQIDQREIRVESNRDSTLSVQPESPRDSPGGQPGNLGGRQILRA